MSATCRAACLQLTPGNELAANMAEIARLVGLAVRQGATLVSLPEFTTFLDRSGQSMRSSASAMEDSAVLTALRALARQHGIWLLVGSVVILSDGTPESKLVNRSVLITAAGEIAAHYDKIHLFDAQLQDGRTVGESRQYLGGTSAPVVKTPVGNIGMSICYDLRFPQLYRGLARGGAEILSVPSAFTAETGSAHWEPLLRARAIETGCYVLAPATCGTHPGDWQTYGHAMIIDPWGKVLDHCEDQPGKYCIADIDTAYCEIVRGRIPSLSTNPEFKIDQIDMT